MAYYSKWGGSYVRRKATRTAKSWPVSQNSSTQKSWKKDLVKILGDALKEAKRTTVYTKAKRPASTRSYSRKRLARW